MIFFVLYPTALCYLAFRHRRTVRGMVIVLSGVIGLIVLGWLHYQLGVWSDGRIQIQLMQMLLYPYTALVGLIGMYVGLLPRYALPGHCPKCDYDLSGLPDPEKYCPECGCCVVTPSGVPQQTPALVSHPDPHDVPSRQVIAQQREAKQEKREREAKRVSRERDAMLRQ